MANESWLFINLVHYYFYEQRRFPRTGR
jgi:hypothetical protein